MKIDVSSLDRDRFHVNDREIPGLGRFLLIVPHKAMWAWDRSELHLRSLMCRPDGTVVSSGFPKFFNYGENPTFDALTDEGLRDGRTMVLEKLDGSLLIRSVIDGQVHLRTRGCELIASDMRDQVMALVRARYPWILDPSLHREDMSFLMEYVGPQNQIVVRYDDAALIGLGWVSFRDAEPKFLGLADGPNMRLLCPKQYPVTTSDGASVLDGIPSMGNVEGVVTWTRLPDGSIHLSKFKTTWYLRLHAMRSHASPRFIREFCYLRGVTDLDSFKAALGAEGFDWEIMSQARDSFDEVMQHRTTALQRIARAEEFIGTYGIMAMGRRDAAVTSKERLPDAGLFAYVMARHSNDPTKVTDIRDSLMFDMSVSQLKLLKKNGLDLTAVAKDE